MMEHDIPLEAIKKGRDYGMVLSEYRRIWDGAKEAATVPGKTQDEIFPTP